MPGSARAVCQCLCLAGIAAAAPAQTISSPATLQSAPRPAPAESIARPALPPDVAARDRQLRARIPRDQLEWADRTATRKLSPEALRAAVANTWPDLATADAEVLVFVITAAAARDADADVRANMAAMQSINAQKQAQRDAAGGQPSEAQSLRLQMEMDRRAKLMQALSNLMKKTDDTQSAIVQNIK